MSGMISRDELKIAINKHFVNQSKIIALLEEIRDSAKKAPRKTNKSNNDAFDIYKDQIEQVYKAYYPRKIGKTAGLNWMAKKKYTMAQLVDWKKAVINYAEYCKDQEPQYIKHFSTWVKEWEDWIEVDKPMSFEEELAELKR